MQTNCHVCGTALPQGARFCPKCGADVAPAVDIAETIPAYVPPEVADAPPASAPPSAVPAAPRRFNTLVLVAVALVALVALVLFFLIAMPFGGKDGDIARRQVETDTIGEAPAPSTPPSLGVNDSARIEEIPTVPPTSTELTDTSATAPPLVVPPPNIDTGAAAPPPTAPPEKPRPVETRPTTAVTETDAIAIVRGAAHSYYDGVTADCLGVTSEGFVNVGYTIAVSDTCRGTTLGRWRVDARNGEVYRQREDGRYLRP